MAGTMPLNPLPVERKPAIDLYSLGIQILSDSCLKLYKVDLHDPKERGPVEDNSRLMEEIGRRCKEWLSAIHKAEGTPEAL